MRVMKKFFVIAAVLLACGPKEVPYQVSIVTVSCDSASDPFAGVQFIQVRVSGDGLSAPLQVNSLANVNPRQIKIPEIPAGPNRVVEVRGYDGDPTVSGRIISYGASLPFTVPDVVPESLMGGPVNVSVIMRKVNAFTPVASAANPNECQKLKVPRAGHTATLLQNGKVFIAGGYNTKPGSPEKVALVDTETYNPATGALEASKSIALTSSNTQLPRAFHTATLLQSGQVLLWGGETYSGINNIVSPVAIAIRYDSTADSFGPIVSRLNPPSIPRSRHQAAIDANGKVLIFGGITRPASTVVPADKVEWYDDAIREYRVVDGVSAPRTEASVWPVKNGEFIAVAGGSDGTKLVTEVMYFKYANNSFAQVSQSQPPRLADPGRRAAGVVGFGTGDEQMMLLGGYSDVTTVKPLNTSETVNASTGVVGSGPAVGSRGDTCVVKLKDGSIFSIGGRTVDANNGPARSDATTVLIRSNGSGGTAVSNGPELKSGRYYHTCTLLNDGSVLVTGGVNEATSGAQEVLQDAYIYMPPPAP